MTCHPSSDELPILRGSWEANVGLAETEIVCSVGAESIAKAYNAGAKRAQGSVLVFTHSDVEVLTSRAMLAGAMSQAENPLCGVLGIAGAKVIREDAIWWSCRDELSGACLHSDGQTTWMTSFGKYGRVVVLDGVFLMMSRDVYEAVGGFDEYFPGWDYYDVDMSLRIHQKGLVNTTFPLSILHHSVGETAGKESWHRNRALFQERYRGILPVSL